MSLSQPSKDCSTIILCCSFFFYKEHLSFRVPVPLFKGKFHLAGAATGVKVVVRRHKTHLRLGAPHSGKECSTQLCGSI